MNYGMSRCGPETTETDELFNQTSASTQILYLPRYIKAETIFETPLWYILVGLNEISLAAKYRVSLNTFSFTESSRQPS